MASEGESPTHKKRRILAALVVVAILVTCAVLARRAGVDSAYIKGLLARMGPLAAPAFVLIFIVGQFLSLPGVIFLAAARFAFGPVGGVLLGYGGALIAVSLSFVSARFFMPQDSTGEVTFRPKWKPLARAFDRLEAHPVRTVALLRTVFWLSAPFNYALATSRIKTRDYILGSAIGLLIPVPAIVLFTGLF
ncbi:MAG: VTT domain-containing protein [Polyangiaceae bacterium]